MVIQIRIDDRLIHGQVALLWTKALDTKVDFRSQPNTLSK